MPVFDFVCPKCGKTRSEFVSVKEDNFVAKCVCGEVMNKVYSFNGVSFKGNGFYKTDKDK